jgi:hypothetical protein
MSIKSKHVYMAIAGVFALYLLFTVSFPAWFH